MPLSTLHDASSSLNPALRIQHSIGIARIRIACEVVREELSRRTYWTYLLFFKCDATPLSKDRSSRSLRDSGRVQSVKPSSTGDSPGIGWVFAAALMESETTQAAPAKAMQMALPAQLK